VKVYLQVRLPYDHQKTGKERSYQQLEVAQSAVVLEIFPYILVEKSMESLDEPLRQGVPVTFPCDERHKIIWCCSHHCCYMLAPHYPMDEKWNRLFFFQKAG
jgi:hypothetical protein